MATKHLKSFHLIICAMAITRLAVCIWAALHRSANGFNAVPKVVGGQYADIRDFPHAASLSVECVQSDGSKEKWKCGSSILNQWVLLTAAHCVAGCYTGTDIIASVGHNNKLGPNLYSAKSYVGHQDYIATVNDIGLVRLRNSLKFGSNVRRIILLENIPRDEVAYLAGWGLTSEEPRTAGTVLKSVVQYVRQKKFCRMKIGSMPKGTICASSDNPSHFPSSGDSGGALVVRGFIQIGIVSYKMPNVPELLIYTNTGYFYDWIQTAMVKVLRGCDYK